MAKRRKDEPESSPPGEFVSDDLRAQTARFLDELKRRLQGQKPELQPKLGPPKRQSPRARD